MDSASTAYTFPSERTAREALSTLLGETRSSAPRRVSRRMRYLDTAAWDAYRRGARLAVAWEGRGTFLLWREGAGSAFVRRPIERPPEFCEEIPYDDLREQIGALTGARRLVPVVDLELEGRVCGVLDARDKTVVELVLERTTAYDPNTEGLRKRLAPTLRVIPVLGYRGAYDRLRRAADRLLPGARGEEDCLLERALHALGHEPPAPEVERSWSLRPDMRADDAMKTIFRVLLAALRRNEQGTREGLDAEFLHDFRVAVRRTRSGLGQVPGLFRRSDERRFKRGFSWLGGLTGALRDLDVYLLTLPRHRERVAPELRTALDPLERRLRERQGAEQQKLTAALDSAPYRRLLLEWGRFLGRPSPRRTTLPNAGRPILAVATERIARAHARVVRRGSMLGPASPAPDLHRMRIECKKLRYLLEFFAGLYPDRDVTALVAGLKKLQNSLGDHHDLTVQHGLVLELEREFARPEEAGTREAIASLVRRLDEQQSDTRAEFLARFEAFRAPAIEDVFRSLFGEPAPCA